MCRACTILQTAQASQLADTHLAPRAESSLAPAWGTMVRLQRMAATSSFSKYHLRPAARRLGAPAWVVVASSSSCSLAERQAGLSERTGQLSAVSAHGLGSGAAMAQQQPRLSLQQGHGEVVTVARQHHTLAVWTAASLLWACAGTST